MGWWTSGLISFGWLIIRLTGWALWAELMGSKPRQFRLQQKWHSTNKNAKGKKVTSWTLLISTKATQGASDAQHFPAVSESGIVFWSNRGWFVVDTPVVSCALVMTLSGDWSSAAGTLEGFWNFHIWCFHFYPRSQTSPVALVCWILLEYLIFMKFYEYFVFCWNVWYLWIFMNILCHIE